MQVKIKRLSPLAKIPEYAKSGDAGLDLTATSRRIDEYGAVEYGTGLAIEIPSGYVGLLFPRSSNAKKDLTLSNSVGVVDSGYRGEVIFKFKPQSAYVNYGTDVNSVDVNGVNGVAPNIYEVGERIGQIIILPYPYIEFEEVDELTDTDRGEGGYGSTGE